MAQYLSSELTLDHIDAWFQIGKQVGKLDMVEKGKLGCRPLDPKTGKAAVTANKGYIPPYKRNTRVNNPDQTAYAEPYRKQQEEQLHRHAVPIPRDVMLPREEATGTMEGLELESMASEMTQVTLPGDKTEEEANQVYNNYNLTHRYDPKLPITKYREELVNTIESNQVTVIEGDTGSGKTTQVPQYILDHYAKLNKYCNIVVTQPRRIAAISIARRVCQERNWNLGGLCGYKIGLDKVESEDTRLTYVTTGVLLRTLIKDKNMLKYTHVILDEVHERDQQTDFALLVVRKLLRTNSRHVKVVLMSASIDPVQFAKYFSLSVRGELDPAPICSVEGNMYTVTEYFVENLKSLGPLPQLDPRTPEISRESYDLAYKLITHLDKMEVDEQGADKSSLAPRRDCVLVFLPGLGEINNMDEKLRENGTHEKYKLQIIPLHSTITAEEQSRVFESPEPGYRKVILSTNIAESSITVPDIRYVIDFCLTKCLLCDPNTNYTSLQLEWASKANCKQRKGRAGRVMNGRVYRMVTRRFFDNDIQDYGTPEMQRCPLDSLVLQAKMLDMGEPRAVFGIALSPPFVDDLERTILSLKEVGALASLPSGEVNPHDGQLTFVGRVLASLPVDIRIGKLILIGHVFGMLDQALTIGAALSLKSIFSRPYNCNLEAYHNQLVWAHKSFSDCIAILNAYKVWENKKNMGEFMRSRHSELSWGRSKFIQIRNIREVEVLKKELAARLASEFFIRVHPNLEANAEEDQLILKLMLSAAFYPNYFQCDQLDEQEAHKQLCGMNPFTTVMVNGLPQNEGMLYKSAIQSLFRCCQEEMPPKLHFEETRAFIEFNRSQKDASSNQILLPVYLAIKLGHLRNVDLSIERLSSDVRRQKLSEIRALQENDARRSNSLRSNRFKTQADGVLRYEKDMPGQVELPGPDVTALGLFVTEVQKCGHFWAHKADEETWSKLEKLQSDINKYEGQNLRPVGHVVQGMLCLAPFEEQGCMSYYRARVNRVNGNHVQVFFVDYGNIDDIPCSYLREIEGYFLNLQFQAIECQLAHIRPSASDTLSGTWSQRANEFFARVVGGNQNLIARVFSVVHNVLRVDLYENRSRCEDRHINALLIDKGFADKAEESYVSVQDNEKRKAYTSSRSKTPEKKQNHDPYDWTELRMNLDPSEDQRGGRRGGRIRLKGPISPYVMQFYGMTNNAHRCYTKIDPNSVNCVALEDQPQDKHMKMMVAAQVGLNASLTNMIARQTTLMPSIPGLPQLVCLLFAPRAELRADKYKQRYIGALCGLGWDPDTGEAALPDHDIELSFDTKFTQEDLIMVNAVRMAIDIAIGEDENMSRWGPDKVRNIQRMARDKLLQLFKKKREPVEPQNFNRPYQWNMVKEEDILQIDPEFADCGFLNLHSGIVLADVEDDDEDQLSPEEQEKQRREELKKHDEWLHEKATRSTMRENIHCQLCDVTCITPRELMLHLVTMAHRQAQIRLL